MVTYKILLNIFPSYNNIMEKTSKNNNVFNIKSNIIFIEYFKYLQRQDLAIIS